VLAQSGWTGQPARDVQWIHSMNMTRRGLGTLSWLGLGMVSVLACSSESPGRGTQGPSAETGGSGTVVPIPTTTGSSGSGSGVVIPVGGGSGGGSGGEMGKACASEVTMAEPTPLDIYIMLDISGSMLDAEAGGQPKWTAVKTALSSFLTDPASAGISVGIQYYPLRKPGVPATCASDAECGTGGPCFLKWCQAYSAAVPGGVAACSTDADCQTIPAAVDYGPCVASACSRSATLACTGDGDCIQAVQRDFGPCSSFGQCESDRSLICSSVGDQCTDPSGADRGACVETVNSICFHGTECDSAAYSTPAVEIVPLETGSAAVLASLEAQMPDGDTPSGPALSGAIAHAQDWASANPGHTVVAVLATDGLPTECLPNAQSFSGTASTQSLVEEVASIAQEGLFGTPSVATFVIGVFSGGDTQAPENLRLIAQAGGTREAQIIDTAGNVTQQFLDALNAIRKSRLACEFKIPENKTGKDNDYMAVNVEFTDAGSLKTLYYVETPDRCPAEGGWYYDDTTAKAPTKIIVCPSTCNAFQSLAAGSVQVKLGCRTMIF
jgi:hypothetical protein